MVAGPGLEFGILGPLEVRHDGRPVELRREKERAILGMLLLRVNEVVALDHLAAGLWDDPDTPRPPSTLRVHMSRLRHSLSAAGGVPIVTTARGYALEVDASSVDAARFEAGVAEGRRLSADDPPAAADAFAGALALWRGPVLADLSLSAAAEPEIARLEEARAAALEERLDADLRCGRHHELVGELERLVAEDPLRERLWGQWMVALYRSGRQAEALRAFEDLRVLLRDELGIRPSPALRDLERAILEQDADLEMPSSMPVRRVESAGRPVAPAGAPVPFPRRLLPQGLVPFAGRREQFDSLFDAWKECAAGERRIVLVAGEAGIGKTRLAGEVARRAHDAGGVVLYGRCDEDMAVPFQPFAEALAQAVRSGASPADLGRHAGELVRLVPNLAASVAGLPPPLEADPGTELYRLFDAVAAWLGAVSSEAGALLVLDDLHWSGRPTLLLLRHLARCDEPMRALVVGTYRDTDLGAGHPLSETLADLRREPGFARLALQGLDPGEVREMVLNAGGEDVEARAARFGEAIWSETAGNPFFVQEVLRALPAGDGAGVPEGVRDVVGRRVARLSEPARTVLAAAAVIGQAFDFDVLVAVCGLGEEDVLDALDEATAASLLREMSPGGYEFVHGIVRSSLYEGLGPSRRARRHRQVGEALETLHADDAAALAAHFRLAGGGDPRAVEYAARAAEQAVAQLAFDRAATYYAEALEAAAAGGSDARRRCELLVGLGTAQRLAGTPAFRETLLEAASAAEELGEIALLDRAVLANSRGFASSAGTPDRERVAHIERALAAGGSGDSPTRARLQALLAIELMWGDPSLRRLELADDAVAMARRLGDDECLLEASLASQVACSVPDRVPALVDALPGLVALAERVGDVQQLARACFAGAHHCLEMDRPELAEDLVARVGVLASELRNPVMAWMDAHQRTRMATVTGSGADVEAAAIAALQAGEESGQPDRFLWFAAQMFVGRWAQGRLGETVATLRASAAETPAVPAWRAALPLGLAALGSREEAAGLVAEMAADPAHSYPVDIVWLVGQSLLAEAVAAVGTPAQAATCYAVLAPYSGRIPALVNLARPGVDLWLGMLAARAGRASSAESHLSAALLQHQRLGAPVWTARTELELGRVLLPSSPSRARSLLASARAGAAAVGSADIEAAAGELLA